LKKLILALLLLVSCPAYANERATYYADSFVGRRTATGEIYSHHKLTGAYNHFPLGTLVKVTDTKTGKSVIIRINDRCGLQHTIDLSKDAARSLGIITRGVAQVIIEKVIK
jgi:rare lipoprotein A